jgi:hypothetical protein
LEIAKGRGRRNEEMLIAIIVIVAFGFLFLICSVGILALMVIRGYEAIQSAIQNHSETVRRDVLSELEFVRSQLADYLGNELLEKRVLPTIGYREPLDPVKQLIGSAVTKELLS